jgi:hypothetical protein
MSLARLMLRSLAIAAIQKQTDDTLDPTMAGDRVYDSRLDPIEFTADVKELPAVIVYTDDDDSEIINRGTGDGPRRRTVDLRVEILLGTFSIELVDGANALSYSLPTTDAELEAKLDMFEQQVKWALGALPGRAYSAAFANYVVRVEKISSMVRRDDNGNNKLAARHLIYTCVINDDCPPAYGIGVAPAAAMAELSDLDLANVAPWIRDMILVMYKSPSMQPVINALTGNRQRSAVFAPILKRIGLAINPIPQAAAADLSLGTQAAINCGVPYVTSKLEIP